MRSFFPLFSFILLLAILAGSVIYLARRMHYYFDTENITPLYLTFSFLLVFMIAGLIIFSNAKTVLGSFVYKDAAITMGFLLYLLFAVILVDLGHLFIKASPKIFGIAALALAFIVSGYGVWNSFNIRSTKTDIAIPGLKKDLKVVHLSDIHIGHFRGKKFMQRIVDKSIAMDPDLVMITGDLFDGKIRLTEKSLSPLKNIKVPVLFVNGNHDGYSGLNEINQTLKKVGVQVLQNEVIDYKNLQIIGLNHMRSDSATNGMHAVGGPTIKDVLNQLSIDPDKPSILLHHSPDGIEYANEHGVDLYLTGHTHAGQMFPINLINNLIFKYNKGLDSYKNTKILVSQGIGTFGPPMRIGTKSEIILINLKPTTRN